MIRLAEIRERWLRVCPPCDAGLPGACTHPDADYRPVIADLVDEFAALRDAIDTNLSTWEPPEITHTKDAGAGHG